MGIWERLGLDPAVHRMVALVGGGGKSSTMYAMAKQAADSGRKAVVTTTTHILPHPGLPLAGDLAQLAALLKKHRVVTLGAYDSRGKLTGAGDPGACLELADVVLIEADGAKLRPLKAPADHEPVIPSACHAVIASAGLDCVGRSIGEICHRPERVCALLGTDLDHSITPADVAAILSSPLGGRKGVGQAMAFRCLLNKADDDARRAWGKEIRALLARQGIHSAITYYREEEWGGLCLF